MKRLTYTNKHGLKVVEHFKSNIQVNDFLVDNEVNLLTHSVSDISHYQDVITLYNINNGLTFEVVARFESFKNDLQINYKVMKQALNIIGTSNTKNILINGLEINKAIIKIDNSEEYRIILKQETL